MIVSCFFLNCKILAQSAFWNNRARLFWDLGATFFSMRRDNASPDFQFRRRFKACWKIAWPLWSALITLECLSHRCKLSLPLIWGGQNVEYKLTGSVKCHAIRGSLTPVSHFCGKYIQMYMYTYIIYWTAGSSSILVFIATLLSAYFRLDLLLTWLNEKILTCFNIALDIFSIIISRFIPCSIIVWMGSYSEKFQCYSIMKRCLAFGCCPLRSPRTWEGHRVKPWCKLRVTLVAHKIPTELIWKLI